MNLLSEWLKYLVWNCPKMYVSWPYGLEVNIGSGNGLLASGSKPLPEPMLPRSMLLYSIESADHNEFKAKQNGLCCADRIFKYILLKENVSILIKIALKIGSNYKSKWQINPHWFRYYWLVTWQHQFITWTNTDLLSIARSLTNCSETPNRTQKFSIKKMHMKMSFAKCWPSYSYLNALPWWLPWWHYSQSRRPFPFSGTKAKDIGAWPEPCSLIQIGPHRRGGD